MKYQGFHISVKNLSTLFYSYTFEEVQGNTDIIWKFQRYELIKEYHSRPSLPPPFILLSHIYLFIRRVVLRRASQKHKIFSEHKLLCTIYCWYHVSNGIHTNIKRTKTLKLKVAKLYVSVMPRTRVKSERRRRADVMGVVHEGKLSGICKAGQLPEFGVPYGRHSRKVNPVTYHVSVLLHYLIFGIVPKLSWQNFNHYRIFARE